MHMHAPHMQKLSTHIGIYMLTDIGAHIHKHTEKHIHAGTIPGIVRCIYTHIYVHTNKYSYINIHKIYRDTCTDTHIYNIYTQVHPDIDTYNKQIHV